MADPIAALGDEAFAEAVEEFKAKSPALARDLAGLTTAAQAQAFVVAGVAELDVVADVFRALEVAIATGSTLDDFKAAVQPALAEAWGGTVANPSARVETIFRTNTATAYNHGRYQQATDPDTLAIRPFWRYDAVQDGRTSPLCKACGGVTLPATDPWWQSHIPPLHHRCRALITTLRRRQVEPGDITAKPPEAAPGGGFGRPPEAKPWRPDPDDYPAPLRPAASALAKA